MADGEPTPSSFEDILDIISDLRDELRDDPGLSEMQQTAIEALLAYYLALTKQLKIQIDSLTPGDRGKGFTVFSLTPGDNGKK